MKINVNTLISQEKIKFDNYYEKLLKSLLPKNELSRAILYSSMNGGKRIRPFIVSVFSKIGKVNRRRYFRLAAAIESIHTYSLIHDDLPCMDDDDYRRGKLSLHKKYNEAIAILAGDALHDMAFEIISNDKTHTSSNVRINLIDNLAKITGSKGLAGGQSLDLLYENKKTKKNEIIKMYLMKTSALFSFCCSAPFILANKSYEDIAFAKKYGELYGLIFQIVDDIIDETESFNKLGKTPGKDKIKGKSTLIAQTNKENAIKFCNIKIDKFIKSNKKYFNKWKILEIILLQSLNKFK